MKFPFSLQGKSLVYLVGLVLSCTKAHVNQAPSANAGPDQVINLPTKAPLILSGSGTDPDGKITNYLWTTVSGPNSPSIAKADSSVTQINGIVPGTYVFQLMVTDNGGLSGTDDVSVKVNPPIIDTLSLQPGNNPTEMHIWGNSLGLEGSSEPAPEIGAAAWTSGGNFVGMRAALQFDLSSIPAAAVITSAHLFLYSNHTPLNGNQVDANYGADNSFLVQQITASWDASIVTWNNQPSSTTTSEIIVPSTIQSFLDLDIDVTSLVSNMVTNSTNYGFLIKLQNEAPYTSRIFCSSKYSDATRYPKMVVIYEKSQ